MTEKRKCLILGGSGGVGEHIVKAFVLAGYETLFTYCHNGEKANIIAEKYGAEAFRIDTCIEEEVIQLRDIVESRYGVLDVVVYATGIFEDSLVENMSLESWQSVVNTNLTGAFLIAKHFITLLRKSTSGRFLAIGSVMGESGIYGSCSYGATKAGLIGLIKCLAIENAKYGVTANVVSFGYIDTGMTNQLSDKILENAMKKIPMKQLGDPDDAARIVVDVCSPYTGYMSGQVIRNNGLLYV